MGAPAGEAHPLAKLTDTEAMAIHLLTWTTPFTLREIGNHYGVSHFCCWQLKWKLRWRHLWRNQMSDEDVDALKVELEKMKSQLAKLEEATAKPPEFKPSPQPWQIPDYTEGAMINPTRRVTGVGDETKPLPDKLAADLRADAFKPNPQTAPRTQLPHQDQQVRITPGSGYIDPVPFGRQPGIDHVDALVDAQDRIDAAERRKLFKE
jgi:hypothetical protein